MSVGKTVFLVENIWGGHNITYLAKLSEAFEKAGCQVFALCPDPSDLKLAADSTVALVKLADLPPKRFDFSYWQWLKKTVSDQEKRSGRKPDLVFIPYLDQALFPAYNRFAGAKRDLFTQYFPYTWAGLFFHPGYNDYPGSEVLFESKRCLAVAVLSSLERDRLAVKIGEKAALFPDFAELEADDSAPLVMELKKRAAGRKVVSNIGFLARRKGILTMLDLAQVDESAQFFYFIGGYLQEDDFSRAELNRLHAMAGKTNGNTWLHLKKIPSEEEYNGLLRASDIAYVGYQDFPSSSNLITKAAAFGKPIMACRSGYIGHVVREFQLGVDFDELDPADGLAKLSILASGFQISPEKQAEFTASMSLERLDSQIRKIVTWL